MKVFNFNMYLDYKRGNLEQFSIWVNIGLADNICFDKTILLLSS